MDNKPDILKKHIHNTFRDVELEHMAVPLKGQLCEIYDEQENTQPNRKHAREKIKAFFSFDNENHRRNFIQTTCVFVNFLILGWTYGQLGTAFQDLQLLLNINVKQTSLVFTANSIGYMIGGLSIGFLTEKYDTLLLLGGSTIVTGVLSIVQPWAPSHIVFLAIRFIAGIFCGGLDSGGNAKACACWGKGVRPFMVALHFGYGLGGVLAPLATVYFLAPRLDNPLSLNQTMNDTIFSNDSLLTVINPSVAFLNSSGNITTDVIDTVSGVRYGETKISLAFIMTGVLTIASGCFYLTLFVKGYNKTPQYIRESNVKENINKRVTITKTQTCAFMALLGIGLIAYATVECKLQTFIMPFVLLELDWTKVNGAYLISLVWIFYSIGRFSGITISRFVVPRTLIIVFFSLTIASTAGIWIGAVTRINTLIWIFVPCSGFSISVLWPTFLNWFNENILEINGRIAGFCLVCGCLGFLLDPLYIGVLMQNVSPMYFVYIQIAQASFALSIFIALFIILESFKKQSKRLRTV